MILCCGEALVDMIPAPAPSADDVPSHTARPGGAALNTAIALAGQGADCGLFAGLSRDGYGQMLVAALTAAGVDRSFLVLSDGPTALAWVSLGGEEAEFSFDDDGSAGRMLARDDLPDLSDHVDLLLFGGISLCREPAATTYETLAQNEAGQRLIMLDPNIRPGFIQDETAYRARLDRMIAMSDVVKLSQADLGWLVPGPDTEQDKLGRILGAGPAVVLLTRGHRGAQAFHRNGAHADVSARPVRVTDAVGAGDAFNAGFLAGLSRLGLLDRRAITGLNAGSLTVLLQSGVDLASDTLAGQNTF